MQRTPIATLKDFSAAGRKDGEHMSAIFSELIKPFGDAVPEGHVETFNAWCAAEMIVSEARFREAGANDSEIAAWRNSVARSMKRHNDNAVRKIRARS
jgi:hypothetical protein